MSEVLAFFADNPEAIWWASGVSTATFILGLVLLPVIALSLSPDYFITLRVPKASFRARHPIIRLLVRSLKNALGFVLLVAGVAMLFLPGQGLLTILAGLTLMEFPGKRRLEIWLISRRAVGGALNALRRRFGRPPLRIPTPGEMPDSETQA